MKKKIKAFYKLKKRKWFKTNTKPFLQIHLTEHCNLNCKGCAHFSPIAQPHYLDISSLKEMLQKLRHMESLFSRIELMGGEPLLHPLINDTLIITRNMFPNIQIRLVTNGLLLNKMSEVFFRTCAENSIIIVLSIYPINLNYSQIEKKLDACGVLHSQYGTYKDSKTFFSYKLNPKGKKNIKRNYNSCGLGGRCLQLKNDRIYPCFLSAYSPHLNNYFGTSLFWQEGDYLSIDKPITEKSFHEFINSPVPFCRYCNVNRLSVMEWGLSKKEADEWIET